MVDVGESQCAEECFKWEEFEEADEDEAREEGQGGGEHCCFKQPASRLEIRRIDSGSEDGEGQEEKAINSFLLLADKATDTDGYYQEDSKRDDGVDFEEGGHNGY